MKEVLFYLRPDVIKEIVDYCRNRWVAIEGKARTRRIFVRHIHEKPLKIDSETDLKRIFVLLERIKPRTIYASINVYKNVVAEGLKDPDNIILSSPVFDVDGNLNDVDSILKIAEIIVSELERYGIEKSVFLKWSGRGVHIHINEKAFSEEIRKKYHPLDIAYSVVDFILKKKKEEVMKVIESSKPGERELKVENKIDIQRVFTAPLSFHRYLDFVCVCFKPNELEDFSLDWADPKNFKHNPKWREYEEGEGDELAEISIKEIGGYWRKYRERATKIETKKEKVPGGKIGRFQVMALLQAARYYLLKGNLEKAKSFGLNRAIFYAWAKYYGHKLGMSKRRWIERKLGLESKMKFEDLGDEKAPISDRGWFVMGDQEQLPEDYDKEVVRKINQIVPYEKAWKAALNYLKKFSELTLLSQRDFYEKVYKPVRDNFLEIIKKYGEEDEGEGNRGGHKKTSKESQKSS